MIPRTRFAPSPTGSLHVGGARTALYCWLFARNVGGRFVLRIEDTDQARSTDESTRGILSDLVWLGLQWDEGPELADDAGLGPFFQSQRLDTYNTFFDQLLDADLAYEAWETREELDAMRAAVGDKMAFRYSRVHYTDEQLEIFAAQGRSSVLRLQVPRLARTVSDSILGPVTLSADDVDDLIIRKADGFPTYHFAVVIDDYLMKITQVLRGQEHLMNTAKHMAIATALQIPSPSYGHFPLIFNPGGGKMSKRDKSKAARAGARDAAKARGSKTYEWLAEQTALPLDEVTQFMAKKHDGVGTATAIAKALDIELPPIEVMDFRKGGFVPEGLLNYLALLGWSPGDEVGEVLPVAEMAPLFSLSSINRSPARFDLDKLRAINGEYLRSLPRDVLHAHLISWFEVTPSRLADLPRERLDELLDLFLPRARTFVELEAQAGWVFDAPSEYDAKAVAKFLLKGGGRDLLTELSSVIATVPQWTAVGIQEHLEAFAARRELGLGKIAQPMRVALTGSSASPSIFACIAVLQPEQVQQRIAACVASTAS